MSVDCPKASFMFISLVYFCDFLIRLILYYIWNPNVWWIRKKNHLKPRSGLNLSPRAADWQSLLSTDFACLNLGATELNSKPASILSSHRWHWQGRSFVFLFIILYANTSQCGAASGGTQPMTAETFRESCVRCDEAHPWPRDAGEEVGWEVGSFWWWQTVHNKTRDKATLLWILVQTGLEMWSRGNRKMHHNSRGYRPGYTIEKGQDSRT